MSPYTRRNVLFYSVLALGIAGLIIFPRMRSLMTLASRELKYLWWLVLIGGLGVYFAVFAGRKRE
jgi:hypothetical protein